MSVTVKYKGSAIASANTDTTKTLKTSGKYCEGDIIIENVQDGGITPSGNINITDTNVTDVTNYATAQVVDADLVAENIKKDVNILGVVGTFEGGGGGSLPSSITKIDGGSFTVASVTDVRNYSISHNLGEKPKGFVIWSDDVVYGTGEPTMMVANIMYKVCEYSATAVASYMATRKPTSGTFGQYTNTVTAAAESSWLSPSYIKIGIGATSYKSGATYNWIAWA